MHVISSYSYRNPILIVIVLLVSIGCSKDTNSDREDIKRLQVGNVELHYRDLGEGFPVILVHGGLSDLYYWKNQDSVLSQNFRMITYSRRYNYPNNNETEPDHNASVEAKDLLGLMDELKIKQAYIIGHSYGAYTALWFALDHPERVKKLILGEPPLFPWLPNIPGGEGRMERFMEKTWNPVGEAFATHGERAGLDTTTRRWFHIPLDSIPSGMRDEMFRNVKEWQALAASSDVFPMVDVEKVKKFAIPTLLLSGALNAGQSEDLIDGELARLLPNNKRVIIEKAGHEMFVDNPEMTNKTIIDFLKHE